MSITMMFRSLSSVLTADGRAARKLASDFNIRLADAFHMADKHGGIDGARVALRKQRDRGIRPAWDTDESFRSPRPPNTYTSGSRLMQ